MARSPMGQTPSAALAPTPRLRAFCLFFMQTGRDGRRPRMAECRLLTKVGGGATELQAHACRNRADSRPFPGAGRGLCVGNALPSLPAVQIVDKQLKKRYKISNASGIT